ncbi:hypothetical protein ACFFRR_002193 [Megaselia abdita]
MENIRKKILKFIYFLFMWKFVISSDISLPYRQKENLECIYHESKFTCDCGNRDLEYTLRPQRGSVSHIMITNCESLEVESNLIVNTEYLRRITFKNINNLVLQENSLEFPRDASNYPLIVNFENVNVDKIHPLAISGNIEEVSFTGGSIGTIRQFAFTSNLKTAVLMRFESVYFDIIEAQAFKKFSVQQMDISNCHITSDLPSKSFYEIGVEQFLKISNNTFKKVHSRAFSFHDVSKLHILSNRFQTTEGEWIMANVKENILIKGNYFGNTSPSAFKGIEVQKSYVGSERIELRFTNNSIGMGRDVLPIGFNAKFLTSIQNLQYENAFPCGIVENRQPKDAFFKNNENTIYFRTVNTNQSMSVAKIIDNDCPEMTYTAVIVVGVLVGLVILGAIVGFLACFIAKRQRKRKLDIILPDPRTYKETQIVYKIEHAGLLKTDL